MALRPLFLAETATLIALLTLGSTDALGSAGSSKAISGLRDATVKALGLQANDLKISGFDISDALVGHSVAYEFDIEIDKKVLPVKLLEDVNRWEYVDLPIFRTEDPSVSGHDHSSLVERKPDDRVSPVLPPFQLAGPMEIWIQDAKDMRLSLPHDVDAGVLKKVVLADGAVVSVKGARSVSLRHPLDLPLPLNQSQGSFASALLTLADRLRHSSRTQKEQPLSLRIVGPTSLTSSPFSSDSKLKLKRLAPGLVELSSQSRTKGIQAVSTVDGEEAGEPTILLTPDRFNTMWPVTSINGSNPNLQGFEALLLSVLGDKANKEGSFRLLKADVSAQTFVKLSFGLEKALKEGGEEINWEAFPEWRTRPESVKMQFEVLAKVDGEKVVPEKVVPVKPIEFQDSTATHVLTGNVTMSKVPVFHAPSDPFTL
ncbi:uncharacterized protein LOC122059182 [Macadamia integrifolia]|uniref:uncharacterized protein LOC122059182 n=1 Tax=Macadamia integrifolia TaxID=60698 RepID=UPI001C528B42|nr:uncharacterized protein LOC122059182 [Macadamia integrifolia]